MQKGKNKTMTSFSLRFDDYIDAESFSKNSFVVNLGTIDLIDIDS